MTWARLDDGFPEHPKVLSLSDRAIRLWITGLCYAARNLTDGLITEIALKNVARSSNLTRPNSVATALVKAGLWEQTSDQNGAYRIHDYLKYNPSKADVERERAAARARMQRKRSGEVQANVPAHVTGERSPSPSPTTTTRSGVVGDHDRTGNPPQPPPATSGPASAPSQTRKATRPANAIAVDRIKNIGREIPTEHLEAELRDLLKNRYAELTTTDLQRLHAYHTTILNAGEAGSSPAAPESASSNEQDARQDTRENDDAYYDTLEHPDLRSLP